IDDLPDRGVFQALAALGEGFVEADGNVLHVGVGFFRSAQEDEVLRPGHAAVPVLVVQAHAQEADDLRLVVLLRCHVTHSAPERPKATLAPIEWPGAGGQRQSPAAAGSRSLNPLPAAVTMGRSRNKTLPKAHRRPRPPSEEW